MMTAFLPCRAGSQRVPQKNTKPFAGRADGLLGLKITQLAACPLIDRIMVSTNDPLVVAVAEAYVSELGPRVIIDHRPDHLCSSSTSTDEVVEYIPSVIPNGDVLWTHVTSPFFDTEDYLQAIRTYYEKIDAGTHDSLMSVLPLYAFLWNATDPINYDRKLEKWPRTQTLQPVYEVNSAVFIHSVEGIVETGDRIGNRPYLLEADKLKSFDVDWEDDFVLAEFMMKARSERHLRSLPPIGTP